MKLRNIILMTASVAMTACSKQAVPTAIPEDAKIEQQVEELLSKMDLDAKIGQMTELAIDVLGETINGEFQLDEAKLHKAIAEYKVGSFLNAPGPVAQSPEKWNEYKNCRWRRLVFHVSTVWIRIMVLPIHWAARSFLKISIWGLPSIRI